MAAKDIEYEFVEDPPEELTCSVCIKVLCEPYLMNCCGQQFCKDCLEKWLLKNKTCPHCRSENFSLVLMQPTSREVGELKVYCPNKQDGCKVVLKISEYEEHLSTTDDEGCLYVELKCPNDCTAEVFRGEMQGHIQKECPRRLVSCFHCNLQGEHQHITGDHEEECPSFPLLCRRGCKDTVLRKDIEIHRDTCPMEPVLCPLHDLGCNAKVCRKDLTKHVEVYALQHMTILVKSHMTLKATLDSERAAFEAEHAALKKEHAALAAKHSALEKDYDAEKKLYSAKVKAVEPIVRSLPNCLLARIYTILADPSYIKRGDSVSLVLSEGIEKSGSHHFVFTHYRQPKFRLEWEKEGIPLRYKFKLYSTDLSAITCGLYLQVEVTVSRGSSKPRKPGILARICCNKPQGVLLGAVSVYCYGDNKGPITIGVNTTDNREGCHCSCHEISSALLDKRYQPTDTDWFECECEPEDCRCYKLSSALLDLSA